MAELPTGTVTFLFTDIEGSTTLAQQFPAALPAFLARHHAILHAAIEAHHGHVFQIIGDAFCAAFSTVGDALAAALDAQRGLQHEAWHPAPIKVRMGLHTGSAQAGAVDTVAGGYAGYTTLARTQRVMSVAYGDQILLSNPTAELLRGQLPAEVTLRDMNEHRLKGLAQPEHLWQLVAPGLATEFPPLKSLTAVPNNLPLQLTSFVGREKEITGIRGLLNLARLVTLTGSGGTGKTRLALEVGAEELASFANGVWLIELAPLSDPAQIIPALAQVFGLQELPFNPLANLVLDYVRDKKILLLLDNCEHLIEACARLADDLLHQCAGLKILASSREALGIAGEVAYRIPSLVDLESTQLFVERARAANSNFKLTNANASAIAQICHRLDGIPLAIELAAARVKLLAPEQIASRLDDRFRLLVGGSRTALPRQQTLRALIDWSYDLLSDEEKRLLQFASVFVGGWTLDALEAVSEDPNALEHLEGLVNKSLVVTEERESEMRYFMLETIRQYAREKLFDTKQAAAARDRHFLYFDDFSETMWNEFRTANGLFGRDKAYDEIENLRAALDWSLSHYPEVAVHLAANFCIILNWFGKQTEGRTWLTAALEKINALPAVAGEANVQRQKAIGRALFTEGMVAVGQGDSSHAALVLQQAAAISRLTGDKLILGYSLEMYFVAAEFAKMPGGPEAVEEGLTILTDLGDTWGIVMANQNKARVATFRGDFEERQLYLEKNRELAKQVPLSFQAAMLFLSMGMDERYRGNHQAARPYFEEGLRAFQKMGNKNFENVMQSELGHIARLGGHFTQAREIYRHTLVRWQDLGHRSAIANQLECFAFIATAEEEPQRAAKLFGAAEALREKIGSPMAKYEEAEYDQSVARLRAMLPETEFNALWAEGRAMTMEQAIESALEHGHHTIRQV
jgi:predicted ATPase/class 3 adenylate cyclase